MDYRIMENIFYSWEDYNEDILSLVSQIASSNWFPDFIVGVKRGGLIPAVKLSHILDKPLLVVSCQLRDNCEVDLKMNVSKDTRLLFVDDICDSGETFEKISQELNDYKNKKFCSLYHNIRLNFLCDYKARKIDREKDKRWIIFPWEI